VSPRSGEDNTTIKRTILALVTAFLLQGAALGAFPSDDVIRDILKARVDTFKQSVGIVVGVVDSTGTRFVSYGTTHVDGTTPVDEHTIFEIGSISKVFTSIVLADMVRKGEVDFRDPVQTFLPREVTLPTSEGRVITLGHLATHRSGLPRMPNNFARGVSSMRDPYALERMYEFLGTCTLVADIGEKYLYSNLGFGLLAQVLADRAGTDQETLLVNRICGPLGLKDTRFKLSAKQLTRAAGGHDWNHNPTPLLNFDAMKGAGALRSTAVDLLHFVPVNAGLVDSDLWPTLQFAHIDREDAIGNRIDVAMGWHTLFAHGREIILHNGATFGNVAFSGFDKEARREVVVLSNARGFTDDISLYLLDRETKLFRRDEEEPETPKAVDIDIEKLRPLVGEYALGPNRVFVIRMEGDKLFGSNNEGLEIELKAASETEFFFEMAPHWITFKKSKKGKVEEIVFSAFGKETTVKKLEFYRSPASRMPKPPSNLDRYVGAYTVDDSLVVTVSLEGEQLYVQVEDQLRMALIPTSKGFYAHEARAELVFEKVDGGQVGGVVIYQDGEHKGDRVQSSGKQKGRISHDRDSGSLQVLQAFEAAEERDRCGERRLCPRCCRCFTGVSAGSRLFVAGAEWSWEDDHFSDDRNAHEAIVRIDRGLWPRYASGAD
jgi:CubicO group peptidase (beta-lactamase class C family)